MYVNLYHSKRLIKYLHVKARALGYSPITNLNEVSCMTVGSAASVAKPANDVKCLVFL